MEHHSESWRPILENKPVHWRDAWMYEYFEYPGPHCAGRSRAVRTKRWKLIHYIQNPQGHELFDLRDDPEERTNLYDDPKYGQQVRELSARLEQLRDISKDTRAEDNIPALPCHGSGTGLKFE
jgi:arylsulfatase A-like enzyme